MAIRQWLQPLVISDARLYSLAHQFSQTYRELALSSPHQFLPTPVTMLPTGAEMGKFLAIDLGGTNLRVAFIELLGSNVHDHEHWPRIHRSRERAWPIGEHLKVDKAENLFAWIGDCIAEVVRADVIATQEAGNDIPEEIPLGITFSFPVEQTSLSEAKLLPMGKGFAIEPNSNLGSMLLYGYSRHLRSFTPAHGTQTGPPLPKIRVVAIANDTVATFASAVYVTSVAAAAKVAMGLIVGTGCNATIPLRMEQLSPAKQAHIRSYSKASHSPHQVVINAEWTISGAAGPLKNLGLITKWDALLDQATIMPGFQPFEYMTAGRYLGELVRLVVLDYFTDFLKVDKSMMPSILVSRNAIDTTFLATVIAPANSFPQLVQTLDSYIDPVLGSQWKWTHELAGAVCQATAMVMERSSAMIAAAVIGLLACAGDLNLDESNDTGPLNASHYAVLKDQPSNLIVAYTGGLITQYPGHKDAVERNIDMLLSRSYPQNANSKVILREATDGGIIGAGVLAGTVLQTS